MLRGQLLSLNITLNTSHKLLHPPSVTSAFCWPLAPLLIVRTLSSEIWGLVFVRAKHTSLSQCPQKLHTHVRSSTFFHFHRSLSEEPILTPVQFIPVSYTPVKYLLVWYIRLRYISIWFIYLHYILVHLLPVHSCNTGLLSRPGLLRSY